MIWNADKFRNLRKQLGMNQHQAAKWLDCSQKSICNWERRGRETPREYKCREIAYKIAAFEVTGIQLPLTLLSTRETDDKWALSCSNTPIVLLEFVSGLTETYGYETPGLLEYIARNFDNINCLQVLECKSTIGVNDE